MKRNRSASAPISEKKLMAEFSQQETQRRFEAALRGARIAGAQHKESVTPKLSKPQRKRGALGSRKVKK